jgi:hypothetical protein
LYTIDASAATAIAFFAEHVPTEFEATEHYLKDTSGVDIEPVAQEPIPGEGGHAHGHGGDGGDPFAGFCVCQAITLGWTLDCTNQAAISAAVASLDANTLCLATNPPQSCIPNYLIMQAHHDHCLHDALPTGIEQKLHDYEHFYNDCYVKRQFDPDLSACPAVECADQTSMTNAVATLQAGCTTTQACADSTCSNAIKLVLAAHDLCPENVLPNNLEVALHDHEEPCEAQLCNTAGGAFDPNDVACQGTAPGTSNDVSAASGFGSQKAFLVTMSMLSLVVCSFLS